MVYEPKLPGKYSVYTCIGRYSKRHDPLILKVPRKALKHLPRGIRVMVLEHVKGPRVHGPGVVG